jgi:hypothetical protein
MNNLKLGLIGLLAAGLLTACPGGGGGGPATGLAITGPDSLSAGAAPAGYTVNAAPAGGTGTVQWTLNPPTGGGTLSSSTGTLTSGATTVNYTPPATVTAALSVTLTATLQGNAAVTTSKTITINPATSSGITINGVVKKWDNVPLTNTNVIITDSSGPKTDVQTDAVTGTFTVTNVITPYSISVVPAPGTGYAPITYDRVTTATPNVVLSKQAYIGGGVPGFQLEDCNPVRAPATILLTLNTPISSTAGSKGEVFFVGEGISFRPLESFVDATIAAGGSTLSLSVPFDPDFGCKSQITGRLVVFERDTAGTIIKKGSREVTVVTGNTSCVGPCAAPFSPTAPLTTIPVAGINFQGVVNFPQGLNDGIPMNVTAYVRFQKNATDVPAYFPLTTDTPTRANNNFQLGVYDLSADDLKYRVQAIATAAPGSQITWANSDILTTNSTGLVLSPPSFGATTLPNGPTQNVNTDTDTTPKFTQLNVTGSNLYYRFFQDTLTAGNTSVWLGGSPLTAMSLPLLSDPARIALQQNIDWAALNSLQLRDANATNSSDIVLGKATGIDRPYNAFRNLYGFNSFSEIDLIASGSFNLKTTKFCIITAGQSCP